MIYYIYCLFVWLVGWLGGLVGWTAGWFVWDTDPREIGLRDLLAVGLGRRRRSTDLTSQRSGRNSRI